MQFIEIKFSFFSDSIEVKKKLNDQISYEINFLGNIFLPGASIMCEYDVLLPEICTALQLYMHCARCGNFA